MGLIEQLVAVERLLRRPEDLSRLDGLAPGDAAVLRTIDAARLRAVSDVQAGLLLARWWRPRFPMTVATLLASSPGLARELVGSPRLERARGEDEQGAAFVGAVLDGLADARLVAPPWLHDVLAYEYLLTVGLPRRAGGLDVCAETERRLLSSRATFHADGRLARPVVAASFEWAVGALCEGRRGAERARGETRLLFLDGDEVVDVDAPDEAADAVALLAQGAGEAGLRAAFGARARGLGEWLARLGLWRPGAPRAARTRDADRSRGRAKSRGDRRPRPPRRQRGPR